MMTATARATSTMRAVRFHRYGGPEVLRFEDAPRPEPREGVDAVLDTVGGETQRRSWRVLGPDGILVSIAHPPARGEATRHDARAAYVVVRPDAVRLEQIGRLIDEGIVRPVLAAILPIDQARKAQELSRSGHVRGKLVLDVAA